MLHVLRLKQNQVLESPPPPSPSLGGSSDQQAPVVFESTQESRDIKASSFMRTLIDQPILIV